jgi:hypothetical protein
MEYHRHGNSWIASPEPAPGSKEYWQSMPAALVDYARWGITGQGSLSDRLAGKGSYTTSREIARAALGMASLGAGVAGVNKLVRGKWRPFSAMGGAGAFTAAAEAARMAGGTVPGTTEHSIMNAGLPVLAALLGYAAGGLIDKALFDKRRY